MTEDKKDANGGLSLQSKQRKTLKLKSLSGRKRLGVDSASHGGAPVHTKSGTRSGTVVVVTKPKGISTNEVQDDSLNDPEIRRKLDILKNASQSRGVSIQDTVKSDKSQGDDNTNVHDTNVSVSSDNKEEKKCENEAAAIVKDEKKKDTLVVDTVEKKVSDTNVDTELKKDSITRGRRFSANRMQENVRHSNSKIRNLDSLGRKKPKKDESDIENLPTSESVDNSKEINTAKNLESKKAVQNKVHSGVKHISRNNISNLIDEEEKEVVPSKKRSNKNRRSDKGDNKKLSIAQLLKLEEENADDIFRPRGIRAIRAFRNRGKSIVKSERDKIVKTVTIYDGITVQEISSAMSEKVSTVIKKLMSLGIIATINQSLDIETAEILVSEMGHFSSVDTSSDIEKSLVSTIRNDKGKKYRMIKRSPIVTIMGHVDHGKTSLLDAYRKSRVVEGEAGGITQHIAAYQVDYNDNKITFLDTPGHAAFTAMRLRGAMVTDIVVIIIAADDGVMEQTVEAINHAKAAKVPIIVAINKIDKPEADSERVKNQLLSYNLIPEDMGGDIMVVKISAAKQTNLEELLDAILLQSEMLDLNVADDRPAVGSVVESRMERLHGVTTTLLLKKGTLKIGDIVVAGKSWGKVKNIYNDIGKGIKSATASMPVEVIGLSTTPTAGDECLVVENEKQARDIVEYRLESENKKRSSKRSTNTLESLMQGIDNQKVPQLNVLIKADVHGSMEAIAASLQKIANEEVKIHIMHQAVGGITESDITLARASNAIVIGFNVRAPSNVAQIAKVHEIEIRYYSIIYQLIDDIKMAAAGLLDPIQKEEITGYAEIRDVFNLTKFGKVAGCYITGGFISRDCTLRVIRNDIVIYTGAIKALKRFKDDVKQVKSGFECGLSLEKFDDIKVGDKLEAFVIKEEKRTL